MGGEQIANRPLFNVKIDLFADGNILTIYRGLGCGFCGDILLNVFIIVGIAACAVIASRRFAGGLPEFIVGPVRSRAQTHQTGSGPLAGAGLANRVLLTAGVLLVALWICPIVSEITVWVVRSVAPDLDLPLHPTLQALQDGDLHPVLSVLLWIGAILVAPVAEEFFFRGIMQTVLVNVLSSRRIAIGLTALVFGVVHFTQPHAVVALIVLAALIGYAYERSGSLIVAVLLHAMFNLKTLIWDALGG